MAIFFAVVGLEISREATTGDLRDKRTVAVPALGAIGGLLVPVLIYLAFNGGTDAAHGWGVVMSTDTAFLVGILALFGPKCPDRLRLFLLTLAIVDDIGAITVMSIFYTDEVDMAALALAAGIVVGILVLRWLNVWQLAPYVVAGIALWFAVQASGVHATLAGVIVGLLVPARPAERETIEEVAGYGRKLIDDATAEREHLAELAARAAVPTNDRLQRLLHPWSAFVVVPLFGLANAGIRSTRSRCRPPRSRAWPSAWRSRSCSATRSASPAPPPWRSALGLGELPGRVRWGHLLGGAVLAGIGFTISLFIAELAFDDPQQLENAKIGILAGSLTAAVLGSILLRWLGEKLPLCSPLSDAPPPLPAAAVAGTCSGEGASVSAHSLTMSRPCSVSAQITKMSRAMMMMDHHG